MHQENGLEKKVVIHTVCTKNDDGSYTVVVSHGMTPGDDDKDDHWIES